jgi:hypothetical protein
MLGSNAEKADMGNSSANALLKAKAFGEYMDSKQDLGTNLGMNMYNTERGFQNQMQNMIPTYKSMWTDDLQNMMNVGNMRQQYGQNLINEQKNIWDTRYSKPYERLAGYANLITPLGGLGSQQVSSGGYQTNPIQGALSGALTGASLYNMFKSTPQSSPVNFQPINLMQSMYGNTSSPTLNSGYANWQNPSQYSLIGG